jgi:tetratricopeptide (TPR) repeat protein
MKIALGLALLLASGVAVCSTQLPQECKPPASAEQALRNNPSAKTYDEAGSWFAQTGNLKCALAAYEAAVQLDPHSAQAHYNLGVAHERARQPAAAAAELRLALKYKPGMTKAHNSLGFLLMDMGDSTEAETEFRAALELDPKLVLALVGLGMVRANKGDAEGAEKLFRQAMENDPSYEQAHLNLGLDLAKQ